MTAGVTTDTVPVRLRTPEGHVLDLPVAPLVRAPPYAAERRALDAAVGPALDIGCGPGRHLVALAERRVLSLGIDISAGLLDVARRRGVNVLERSVFDRVPGAGRWRSALLLDGNIGIGGDPVALLRASASCSCPTVGSSSRSNPPTRDRTGDPGAGGDRADERAVVPVDDGGPAPTWRPSPEPSTSRSWTRWDADDERCFARLESR